MARRCALTVTDQDLQAAWLHRRRSDWPRTFDAAMAHPLLRALVRAEALRGAQAAARRAAAPAPHQPPASHQPLPAVRRTAHHATADRKRAAAGDRDDD